MTRTAPALELFGHEDSGYACKVALALALAGLPYVVHRVDIWAARETRPSGFLAANPVGEVPMLLIDSMPFVQSGAILLEIATRFRCLGGESEAGLRRGRELLMWEANRIGMCLPQLRLASLVNGTGFPPAVLDWLKSRYSVDCARFDSLLGGAPFFHGDAPGIGDCAIWGYTQWLDAADVKGSPSMNVWLERMRDLPGQRDPHEYFMA